MVFIMSAKPEFLGHTCPDHSEGVGTNILHRRKNRGRTFEEVWNNDHDNSYKNWLQKRLHDIDIVYPAFVVYAELMESLQCRPSWRVHQNQ